VLGDFNSILNVEDRIGGNPITWAEMMDFNKCVKESRLLEFPTQGNKYTWSDKHEENRIFFQNRQDIHQQRMDGHNA